MLGTASLLFLDITALILAVPVPPGEAPPVLPPPALLKIASVIQPAILTTIAILLGWFLAPKVDLHAPAAEAASSGESIPAKLLPQILPGVLSGLASGVAIVGTWVIAKPFLTSEFISRAEGFNRLMPHITRFLYGGFAEELLLRWGVMTFLVWAAWRLFQKGEGKPRSVFVVVPIFLSALLFGAGHLPIASLLAGGLTFPLVVFVISSNSLFGIVAGFLYWKKGLEAAFIAHIMVHVVLISAIYLAF